MELKLMLPDAKQLSELSEETAARSNLKQMPVMILDDPNYPPSRLNQHERRALNKLQRKNAKFDRKIAQLESLSKRNAP